MKDILVLLALLITLIIYVPIAVIAIIFGQTFKLLDSILKQVDKMVNRLL